MSEIDWSEWSERENWTPSDEELIGWAGGTREFPSYYMPGHDEYIQAMASELAQYRKDLGELVNFPSDYVVVEEWRVRDMPMRGWSESSGAYPNREMCEQLQEVRGGVVCRRIRVQTDWADVEVSDA